MCAESTHNPSSSLPDSLLTAPAHRVLLGVAALLVRHRGVVGAVHGFGEKGLLWSYCKPCIAPPRARLSTRQTKQVCGADACNALRWLRVWVAAHLPRARRELADWLAPPGTPAQGVSCC